MSSTTPRSTSRGRSTPTAWRTFWSVLKRAIKGTYVSVEPFHHHRYLDQQTFRYNARKGTDGMRFLKVAAGVIGKRLMYRDPDRRTGYDVRHGKAGESDGGRSHEG